MNLKQCGWLITQLELFMLIYWATMAKQLQDVAGFCGNSDRFHLTSRSVARSTKVSDEEPSIQTEYLGGISHSRFGMMAMGAKDSQPS